MAVKLGFEDGGITAEVDFTEALRAAAGVVEERARELCPVDTGYLKSSISSSVDGGAAYVSAGAPYAAYVEFGTSKAAAQPFLVPALLNNAGEIAEAFAKGMVDTENG
ncbi:MAG: HK97 gp10 family phage protein [Firmicutes bacterium]|nr:HK97 gp10 family phage protein [Bacillota bacterium]